MKYRRFEVLVLTVGAAAIVASLFLSPSGAPLVQEVIAQLMLLGVLVAAVHWGRTGGFIAATLASLIYIVMRVPMVASAEGLTAPIATLLLVRVLTYGLVGIVGGELCGRIKYIFAKLENSSSIDDWSQIYNQRGIVRALETACGQYTRYETPCSVVTVAMDPHLTEELRPSRQRSLVRGVASYIRSDIRLVDEAGRLDDGRFIVILTHTPDSGAEVVANRLHKGICNALGAKEESLTIERLSAPEGIDAIVGLKDELASELAEVPAQGVLSSS